MPNTTNFLWNQPTVGADLDTWGDELNAQSQAIDSEMFLKANKANPVFTGSITAPAFIGNPNVVIRPTVNGDKGVDFQNAAGMTMATLNTVDGTFGVVGVISATGLIGNPNIYVRPLADGPASVAIQNAAGTNVISVSTPGGQATFAGTIQCSLYSSVGNVILRPAADTASGVVVQNAAGTAVGVFSTIGTGRFTIADITANIGVTSPLYTGTTRLTFRPTANSTDAYIFQNAGGSFCGSLAVDASTSGLRMSMGPAIPHPGAQLDLQSTSHVLYLNRLTTAQRLAVVAPAVGMLLYDTDLNKLIVVTNFGWQAVNTTAA